jgi:hypothetical protein
MPEVPRPFEVFARSKVLFLSCASPRTGTRSLEASGQTVAQVPGWLGISLRLLRLLRNKPACESTFASPKFIRLQVEVDLVAVIKKPCFWKGVLALSRTVFAALCLLRLADKKVPAMDKLYFYVGKTDDALLSAVDDFNDESTSDFAGAGAAADIGVYLNKCTAALQ